MYLQQFIQKNSYWEGNVQRYAGENAGGLKASPFNFPFICDLFGVFEAIGKFLIYRILCSNNQAEFSIFYLEQVKNLQMILIEYDKLQSGTVP